MMIMAMTKLTMTRDNCHDENGVDDTMQSVHEHNSTDVNGNDTMIIMIPKIPMAMIKITTSQRMRNLSHI